MRQVLLLITIMLIVGFITACNTNKQQANKSTEDFKEFHTKFYADSVFQLSRTIFPLPGADSDVIYGDEIVEDQENDNYFIKDNKLYWKKEGWRFIEAPIENEEFVRTIEKNGAEVREQISSKETDWVITYIFSLVDNRWVLSYYASEWY